MSPTLQMELWLVKRLGEHGVSVFDGDTTPELRQQRVTEAILTAGLASVVIGRRNGRPRALSRADELRVFREVTSTRRYCRGGVYLRLARELGVGVSTLQAIALDQVIAHGGTSLKTFELAHEVAA